MCGICGYITKKRIDKDRLRVMNDSMVRRGPNDSGVFQQAIKEDYELGLAQRRLSIQDLSELGHQPMDSADGRLSIVFNGEIYNFIELREELSDYPFRSTCDTEVILAAYLKWGIDMISHIHGMFAIALFDREDDSLYLIRDRIGKKPLYYYLEDGGIVFASQLSPIMLWPTFKGDIDSRVLTRYLYQQYINAPDSIFKDVYKLEAGSYIRFRYGSMQQHKYWSVRERYGALSGDVVSDYDTAKAHLRDLLRDATRRRMIADVPIGSFLSGGYDSSLITAIASEISPEPVKTFSIGFEDEAYNEAPFARAVADHLGCRHTEVIIGGQDMLDQVGKLAECYDEPFADSSQIPGMLVAEVARRDVTVVLSGDAGDEFFCGYNIYDKLLAAQKLDGLGGIAALTDHIKLGDKSLLDRLPFKVRAIASNRDPLTKTQLSSMEYVRAAERLAGRADSLPAKYPVEDSYDVGNWQIRRMLLDMDTYLPEDILTKVDRSTMYYSLEGRCPIMDTEVMEYSFRLPHSFKYRDGIKKYILRDITWDYLPRELMERPKKGFSVPLDAWLRGPLKEELLSFSDETFIRQQGLFNAGPSRSFIGAFLEKGDKGAGSGANYSGVVWSYYVFQKWYEKWIKA
ncbi:asparagine synthase (glutamine-hydrolyzing) [Butyrivibrio sp. MC2013]|uniref:asparagine synthase (glutamine-hydrolyzing) n=1 Tax=Butyrivibrio sp. MC2013 TaxID=1280686 RepID=UPI000401B717|nr:asparagine synthase (glutamine-hydrolyzing) [Butyrivibrio sp. MC2013]